MPAETGASGDLTKKRSEVGRSSPMAASAQGPHARVAPRPPAAEQGTAREELPLQEPAAPADGWVICGLQMTKPG